MSEPICKECMHREYCNRSDINFHPKPEVVPPVLQCDSFKTAKITNADRIRSMTDEELARFLYIKTCEDGYPQFDNIPRWLEWLKQEAEE